MFDLQKTPLDDLADQYVYSKTDDFIAPCDGEAPDLNSTLHPQPTPSDQTGKKNNKARHKLTIYGVNVDKNLPHSYDPSSSYRTGM